MIGRRGERGSGISVLAARHDDDYRANGFLTNTIYKIAQSAGAVEYTDYFSAEGKDPPPPNECPGYDTKQSNGEVLVLMEHWGIRSTPSLTSLPGLI